MCQHLRWQANQSIGKIKFDDLIQLANFVKMLITNIN